MSVRLRGRMARAPGAWVGRGRACWDRSQRRSRTVEAKLVQSRLEAQIDEEAGDLRVALHLGRLHLRVDHLLPQRAVAHVRALRQDEHAAAPDVKRALDRAA
eukprot:7377963-Prymnesium_polylepis.3